MTEWMPIETAPKDGSLVLVTGVWAGEINGIIKEETGPFVARWYNGKSDYAGDGWWEIQGTDAYAAWCLATHWLFLPDPPRDAA